MATLDQAIMVFKSLAPEWGSYQGDEAGLFLTCPTCGKEASIADWRYWEAIHVCEGCHAGLDCLDCPNPACGEFHIEPHYSGYEETPGAVLRTLKQ
ncbi:MAG: hypothetical protein GY937_22990 [bacterium]|nr:hypothetical protein [bacterium]